MIDFINIVGNVVVVVIILGVALGVIATMGFLIFLGVVRVWQFSVDRVQWIKDTIDRLN